MHKYSKLSLPAAADTNLRLAVMSVRLACRAGHRCWASDGTSAFSPSSPTLMRPLKLLFAQRNDDSNAVVSPKTRRSMQTFRLSACDVTGRPPLVTRLILVRCWLEPACPVTRPRAQMDTP